MPTNMISLAIWLFLTALFSGIGLRAYQSSHELQQFDESVSILRSLVKGVRTYDLAQCPLIGVTPTGQTAPSCTVSDWPTSLNEVVQEGFLPASDKTFLIPLGGGPVTVSPLTVALATLTVPVSNASLGSALAGKYNHANYSNGILTIYVSRNDESGWDLAQLGNVQQP